MPEPNLDEIWQAIETLDIEQIIAIPPDRDELPEHWPNARDKKPRACLVRAVEDLGEATLWAKGWNENGAGLYWSINSVSDPRRRASKTRVTHVRTLHVDDDDRAYENGTGDGAPPPTVVIDSGGGLQLLWALEEAEPVGVELAALQPWEDPGPARDLARQRWLEVERYNKALAEIYSADHCWNVDRVFRLPGTVNWPSSAKRARGRVPVMARLLEAHPDRIYPLSAFPQSEPLPERERIVRIDPSAVPKVSRSALRRLLKDPSLRGWITEGTRNPDAPLDRSRELFSVCCQLVRKELSNEMIYAIVADPAYAISSHARDQADPRRATERAIEAARDAVRESREGKKQMNRFVERLKRRNDE